MWRSSDRIPDCIRHCSLYANLFSIIIDSESLGARYFGSQQAPQVLSLRDRCCNRGWFSFLFWHPYWVFISKQHTPFLIFLSQLRTIIIYQSEKSRILCLAWFLCRSLCFRLSFHFYVLFVYIPLVSEILEFCTETPTSACFIGICRWNLYSVIFQGIYFHNSLSMAGK